MRMAILICCILALAFLALLGLSYTAGISLEISVTKVDNGVIIRNVGNVPYLVSVCSVAESEFETAACCSFKLAVGANVTLSDITKPVDVSAVSCHSGWVDLFKPAEGWPGIKY